MKRPYMAAPIVMTGTVASMTSVSFQLVTNRMTMEPTTVTRLRSSSDSVVVMVSARARQ